MNDILIYILMAVIRGFKTSTSCSCHIYIFFVFGFVPRPYACFYPYPLIIGAPAGVPGVAAGPAGCGMKRNVGPEAFDSCTRTGRETSTGPRLGAPSTSMPLVRETRWICQPCGVGTTRRWVPETIEEFATTIPELGWRPTVNSWVKTRGGWSAGALPDRTATIIRV